MTFSFFFLAEFFNSRCLALTLAWDVESLVFLESTLQQYDSLTALCVSILRRHAQLFQSFRSYFNFLLNVQLVGQLAQLVCNLLGCDGCRCL